MTTFPFIRPKSSKPSFHSDFLMLCNYSVTKFCFIFFKMCLIHSFEMPGIVGTEEWEIMRFLV